MRHMSASFHVSFDGSRRSFCNDMGRAAMSNQCFFVGKITYSHCKPKTEAAVLARVGPSQIAGQWSCLHVIVQGGLAARIERSHWGCCPCRWREPGGVSCVINSGETGTQGQENRAQNRDTRAFRRPSRQPHEAERHWWPPDAVRLVFWGTVWVAPPGGFLSFPPVLEALSIPPGKSVGEIPDVRALGKPETGH